MDFIQRTSGVLVPRNELLLPEDGKALVQGFRPDMLNEVDRSQYDRFKSLRLDRHGVIHIGGNLRSGKSTWAVFLAWVRRKLWGFRVVSNVMLLPEFGPYDYIDTDRLVQEFRKINKAIEKAVAAGQLKFSQKHSPKKLSAQEQKVAGDVWAESGTILKDATIIWDEGYQDADNRRTSGNKHILLTYLIQMMGHFKCMLGICASSDRLLDDQRCNPFMTHQVKCNYLPELSMSQYTVLGRWIPLEKGINPWYHQIYVPNWAGRMFDSESPVAVDEALLRNVLREAGITDKEEEDRKARLRVEREDNVAKLREERRATEGGD